MFCIWIVQVKYMMTAWESFHWSDFALPLWETAPALALSVAARRAANNAPLWAAWIKVSRAWKLNFVPTKTSACQLWFESKPCLETRRRLCIEALCSSNLHHSAHYFLFFCFVPEKKVWYVLNCPTCWKSCEQAMASPCISTDSSSSFRSSNLESKPNTKMARKNTIKAIDIDSKRTHNDNDNE